MIGEIALSPAPSATHPSANASASPQRAPVEADSLSPVQPVQEIPQDDERPLSERLERELNRRIERLFATNMRLSIEADHETGAFVYRTIDRATGEVKKQWPPEKVLKLMAFLNELEGLLVDKTA